jgi:hypothetical protein
VFCSSISKVNIMKEEDKKNINEKKIEDIQKGEESEVEDIPHGNKVKGKASEKDLKKIQQSK